MGTAQERRGDRGKPVMIGRRWTNAVPLLLVGMLAALTFWLDRLVQDPLRDAPAPNRHDPDYIVEKFSGVRLGKTGLASYTLSAARMVHYPDDDSTLLSEPRFVSYALAKAAVTITSSQAVVSSNGEHVYFQDNVRVTRAPLSGGGEMLMRTAFLHVVPDRNLALTDRSVTITDDAGSVTAEGLEMNNETRVIKLLARVRGTYDVVRPAPGAKR